MQKGQCVVEYLLFFAVIAVLTLVSLCTFYPQIQRSGETAFQQALGELTHQSSASVPSDNPGENTPSAHEHGHGSHHQEAQE